MQCRACMQMKCEGVVDMSCAVSMDGKTVYDYFNDCTQLDANSTDKLPNMLCTNCARNLRMAYNFRQTARRSNEEFKKVLSTQREEPELILSSDEQTQVLDDVAENTNDPLAVPEPKASVIDTAMSIDIPELDITVVDIKTEIFEQLCEEPNEDQKEEVLRSDCEASSQDECESDNNVLRSKAAHICELCNFTYATQKQLKNHIFEMHKSEIICMKCPKVYEFPSELQLHESLVHGTESPMQCPWCNESRAREELAKHLQKKHSNSYLKYFPRMRIRGRGVDDIASFRCEDCEQYFSSVLELADHIKEHKFDCPICSMSFKKHGTYRAHVRRIHNHSITSLKAMIGCNEDLSKPFKCSICSRQFKLKSSHQEHMKRKHNQSIAQYTKNDDYKLYECSLCNMSFGSPNSVYYHKRRKHGNISTSAVDDGNDTSLERESKEETENSELVKCKVCHKEISANQIKYHEKRHAYALNKKRKFLCAFCPREYNSETTVKLHEKKVHLCEKPEPKACPICQKKVDPKYLKHHIENVHTAERKFVCDVCGDSFKSYVLLHSHKRLHLERNFPCTVCEKKFIRSFDLKVHMRIHTGEEPYACHLCDRRFKIKVRLNYHLQRHAGIKRKCNVCGKEFNHVKQLKIHSYKHTGMPYKCSVCDYGCAQRDVFRKHLLRMHDMTMTADEYCAMFKANTGRNPHVKTLEELQLEAQNMEQEEYSN
ncbi:zinc finger protein 546-like isoform X2 [Anastrepha obliqua]|uniref:zinc finger protein 546-like isoform X2 n=1 Tax=Anastrepha obliqua TaxID=95512 RepID=UPI00240A8B75|nr:zinc finger protein 546-like isoform X2 [Anastrepha obliqua]